MSNQMPNPAIASVAKRPLLASYATYEEAQKAVDTLSDNKFPVENVAIVGVDLRIVESVLGRMSWGRAAGGGLLAGAWFGLLLGLFVSLFARDSGYTSTQLIMLGLLYGAAFGIIFGLVSYAFTRGRRDFVSRSQIQALRYDVLCESAVMAQAKKVLGLNPDPFAAPPTPQDTDGGQSPAE